MWPVLGGLITGGASLLGSMMSSDTSAANTAANILAQQNAQANTQYFNAQQADINRDFQAREVDQAQNFNQEQVAQQEAFQQNMSSTAYQRASQDMQKAGLNPMMMFGSGGPASSPSGSAASSPTASGSTASVGTPNMALHQQTSPYAGLGEAVRTGMATAVQSREMDKLVEQTAQTDLVNKALTRELNAGKPEAEVEKTQADTAQSMSRTSLIDQMRNMNIPDEQKALIWNALPDLVKKGQVWSQVGGDVAGSVSKVVAPIKTMLGSSAVSKERSGLSPSQRQDMKDYFSDRFNAVYGHTGE